MTVPQILLEGVLNGALIALGAIGLTLTYAVLRFANFVQGEMLTCGAYLALVVAAALAPLLGDAAIEPFTFSPALLLAAAAASLATGLVAIGLDRLLFRTLRRRATAISMVIASFGASLALRSLIEVAFTSRPRLYGTDIPIALHFGGGFRATPDQLFLLALMLVLMLCTHGVMVRTPIGRAMRAVSENPDLARVYGVDVGRVIETTWLLGGALAAMAGVFLGIIVQVRPYMGFDLLLPLFAAAILGGIGSVPGAMAGGLIVGFAEAMAVPLLGAEYRAAAAFLLLIAALVVRPSGLFGGN